MLSIYLNCNKKPSHEFEIHALKLSRILNPNEMHNSMKTPILVNNDENLRNLNGNSDTLLWQIRKIQSLFT